MKFEVPSGTFHGLSHLTLLEAQRGKINHLSEVTKPVKEGRQDLNRSLSDRKAH